MIKPQRIFENNKTYPILVPLGGGNRIGEVGGDVINHIEECKNMFDNKFPKSKLYLSRRNLLSLLHKLDREAAGEDTQCAIIKHKGVSPHYQQTMDSVMIIAVDDTVYYEAQNRPAGEMHPLEEEFFLQISGASV